MRWLGASQVFTVSVLIFVGLGIVSRPKPTEMNPGILFVALFMAASFAGYFYWAVQMIRGREADVSLFDSRIWFNPFNLCFFPSLLTEEGKRARRRFFISCACIVASFLAMGVVGFLTAPK